MSKLPTLRPSLLDYLEGQKRNAKRQANSSAFARSGTSVTAEGVVEVGGLLASFDFDGTGPSDMGTKGWAFGSDGGPSWFIINGHMIFDDLMAQDALLTAQAATLAATVADLTTAQATLATTVSGLATAVANIATLVGDQVTGTAGNATTGATAVGLSTSAASFATITINVPAGFTVAAVAANTSMAMMGTITGYVRTRIGGSDGPNMLVFTDGTAGNGSSNFSRVFTVTSGGTFTVEARAYGATGSETAYIANAASVTFFR